MQQQTAHLAGDQRVKFFTGRLWSHLFGRTSGRRRPTAGHRAGRADGAPAEKRGGAVRGLTPLAMPYRRWPFLLALLGLFLLAVIPMLPALLGEFLPSWDDGVYVIQNYRIHHLNWENAIDLFRLHPKQGRMPNAQYTPLVELSFMLENHFFGQNPFVFHLNNLLFHACNTLLVCLFVRRLTGKTVWAWLTAAFFAVHPLHVESVAWVTERKDMLSAFFYLFAIVFYLRHLDRANRRDYAAALAAGVLAFLSKPLAIMLPAILLLCAWFKGGRWDRKTLRPLVPFFALSVVGGGITIFTHFTTSIVSGDEVRAVGSNLLIAARGIALYLQKFIWPFGLSAFYPVPELGQPLGLSYIAALTALAVVLGTLAWLAIRGQARVWVYGALFFLIALAPSSRIIPVGMRFLAADRFFYLPGIGLFLLLAYGLYRLLQGRPVVRHVALGLSAGLCLLWAGATWQRTQVWCDDVTLWRDAAAKHPNSAYVLGGLAQALALQDLEAAGRYADQALGVSSRDAQPMLVKAFQHQKAGDYEICLDWLAKAEERNVAPSYIALMMGSTYALMGNPEKAIAAYSRVISFEPQSTEYLGRMALAWLALGNEASGMECLEKMRDTDAALARQAQFLADKSPRYSVLTPLQQAVCLSPELMRYQYELAQNSHFVLQDPERALREYRLLLDYYPAVVDVWQEVADQLPPRQWPGQVFDVQQNHVRKLAIAYYNQACLLALNGDSTAALASLRQAISYDGALRANATADADLALLWEHHEFIEMTRPPDAQSTLTGTDHAQTIFNARTL